MKIREMQDRAHQHAVRHKWFTEEGDPMTGALLRLHLEVSEASDAYRDGHPTYYYADNGKPEGWLSELADVVMRAAEIAGHHGVNLEEAIKEKLEFNENKRIYSNRKRPF